MGRKETLIFNEYIDLFSQFIGEESDYFEPDLPDPDMEDTLTIDSTAALEGSVPVNE